MTAKDFLEQLKSGAGGHFANVIVDDEVILSGCAFTHPVHFKEVTFTKGFTIVDSEFARSLCIEQCTIDDGQLTLQCVRVGGWLKLTRLAITISTPRQQPPRDPDQNKIPGRCLLADCRIDGDMVLDGAVIGEVLHLTNTIVGSALHWRQLSDDQRPQCGGIEIYGSQIGGSAVFDGLCVGDNDENETSTAEAAGVGARSARVQSGMSPLGSIRVANSQIAGDISCNFPPYKNADWGKATTSIKDTLALTGVEVGGSAVLHGLSTKWLNLTNVKIAGDFVCWGQEHPGPATEGKPNPTIKKDLKLINVTVGGRLACYAMEVSGLVELIHTSVGTDLQFAENPSVAYPLFSVGDFTDLASLANKLKDPASLFDTWLEGRLPAETKAALASYEPEMSEQVPLQAALLKDLNEIIRGSSIYEQQRFAGNALRQETVALLSKNPQGGDLLRLNRLLLEDAYPLEVARKHMCVLAAAVGSMAYSAVTVKGSITLSSLKLSGLPVTHTQATGPLGNAYFMADRIDVGGSLAASGMASDGTEPTACVHLASSRVNGYTHFSKCRLKTFEALHCTFGDGLSFESEATISESLTLRHCNLKGPMNLQGLLSKDSNDKGTGSNHIGARVVIADVSIGGGFHLLEASIGQDYIDMNGVSFNKMDLWPEATKSAKSVSETGSSGSTGNPPVPSGDSPKGAAMEDFLSLLQKTLPFRADTYQRVERYLRDREDDVAADLVYCAMMKRSWKERRPRDARNKFTSDTDPTAGQKGLIPEVCGCLKEGKGCGAVLVCKHFLFYCCWWIKMLCWWAIGFGTKTSRMGWWLLLCLITFALAFSNESSVQLVETAPPDRQSESWALSQGEIKSMVALATRLRGGSDEVSRYLTNRLSETLRTSLAGWRGTNELSIELQSNLIAELNTMIVNTSIWRSASLTTTGLRPRTKTFGERSLDGQTNARFNRLLLEDAFPRELVRRDDLRPSDVGQDWSWLSALLMSARVTFSVISPVMDKSWEPSGTKAFPIAGRFNWFTYEHVAGVVSWLNYIVVPLWLVGFSGLLKRRGE